MTEIKDTKIINKMPEKQRMRKFYNLIVIIIIY